MNRHNTQIQHQRGHRQFTRWETGSTNRHRKGCSASRDRQTDRHLVLWRKQGYAAFCERTRNYTAQEGWEGGLTKEASVQRHKTSRNWHILKRRRGPGWAGELVPAARNSGCHAEDLAGEPLEVFLFKEQCSGGYRSGWMGSQRDQWQEDQ